MNRQPWSIPTRAEWWRVGIGMIIGFLLALMLIGVDGRTLAINIFFIVVGVVPFAVFLINAVTWFHEDKLEQKERQRKLDDDIFWLRDANKAVTNKRTGLGWTGRHPRRR